MKRDENDGNTFNNQNQSEGEKLKSLTGQLEENATFYLEM